MKVGYIRVSTEGQNTGRQEEVLKSKGVEKIFIEKVSGKNTQRPQLRAMLDYVREGDVVWIESYDRLARSTQDLLSIVDELTKKNVDLISEKENFDTTSPQGKLMLTIFAGLAEFERTCMLQRQREGIEIAKREGKYKGRKPIEKPENWDIVISSWCNGEISARAAMKLLNNMSAPTFYRLVKADGIKRTAV